MAVTTHHKSYFTSLKEKEEKYKGYKNMSPNILGRLQEGTRMTGLSN